MFIVRTARKEDLESVYQLARHLNTLNLPAKRAPLEELLGESEAAFQRSSRASESHEEGTERAPKGLPPRRKIVFVLESVEEQKVCGVAMLLTVHGTHERPASYFELRERQTYSPILGRHFRHQTLQLVFDYEGPSELGALIIAPRLRGNPLRPGRTLSYSRLAFIAAAPSWFRPQLVAELLPPFDEQGQSPLWDHLGARFTGLDYEHADKLSQKHVHFISELFPHTPIPTALLPSAVQAQLGQIGPKSKPAARLLEAAGFRFDGTIDPFDGGPTLRLRCADSPALRAWYERPFAGTLSAAECADSPEAYLCRLRLDAEAPTPPFMLAVGRAQCSTDSLRVDPKSRELLDLKPGDQVGVLPLPPWA